jgi:ATP-dependent DNA helicase RecG
MRVLGYVQRFGVGIASARRWLREAGHPDLNYAVENNFIQATIWGRSH